MPASRSRHDSQLGSNGPASLTARALAEGHDGVAGPWLKPVVRLFHRNPTACRIQTCHSTMRLSALASMGGPTLSANAPWKTVVGQGQSWNVIHIKMDGGILPPEAKNDAHRAHSTPNVVNSVKPNHTIGLLAVIGYKCRLTSAETRKNEHFKTSTTYGHFPIESGTFVKTGG
jgi:hypothetical protein